MLNVLLVVAASGCFLPNPYEKAAGDGSDPGLECTQFGTGSPATSCAMADSELCGPAGTSEDCCTTIDVPCGEYVRGYDGVTHTDDSHPATIDSFRLDKFEVTVGRFRGFVDAGAAITGFEDGAGAHPHDPASGWQVEFPLEASQGELEAGLTSCTLSTWTTTPGSSEDLPITCVTWYEALAFCIWDGGYLPSEAEWNYVATGGALQRVYPWSNPASNSDIDNLLAVWGCPTGSTSCIGPNSLGVPGSRNPQGAAFLGHADLAGNVYEWVLDWKDWQQGASFMDPCIDCIDREDPEQRTIRGGGAYTQEAFIEELHANFPNSADGRFRYPDLGFRCARPPR